MPKVINNRKKFYIFAPRIRSIKKIVFVATGLAASCIRFSHTHTQSLQYLPIFFTIPFSVSPLLHPPSNIHTQWIVPSAPLPIILSHSHSYTNKINTQFLTFPVLYLPLSHLGNPTNIIILYFILPPKQVSFLHIKFQNLKMKRGTSLTLY